MRLAFLLVAAVSLFATGASEYTAPTAKEIIERIQKNVGIPWNANTVDTVKAGDPDTPVTGIAVTMMATMDVLERVAASGKNLVITHEPAFYSHLDTTKDLEAQNDEVLAAKQRFIEDHHMVVWRFHDHWHARHPDGILLGMTKALGWLDYQDPSAPHQFTLPSTTVNDLAESMKKKLQIRVVRIVGDPNLRITKVNLMPGAAGAARQIRTLESPNVELLVIGEVPEWETIEYVADASAEGKRKALILLGHISSEQAGMEECALWLQTFIKDVPVSFVPSREFFVEPK